MDIHSQMLQFLTQMLKYDLVTHFCFLRQYFQTEGIETMPIIDD